MPVLQGSANKRSSGFSIDSLISRDVGRKSPGNGSSKSPNHSPPNRSPPSGIDSIAIHSRELQHHHQQHQQHQQRLAAAAALGMTGGNPLQASVPGMPHPAFWGHSGSAAAAAMMHPGELTPPGAAQHPNVDSAALAHLLAQGVPPSALGGLPSTSAHGFPVSPGFNPHGHVPQHLLGMTQKDNFPFYTWLLSRHGHFMNRGLSGRSIYRCSILQNTVSI